MDTDPSDPRRSAASLTERPLGESQVPAARRCTSCRGEIAAADKFCKHCGRRQAKSEAWYHEPVAIAVLALTVLGPFALPMVWKSPKISRTGKWAWTILLVGLTVAVLWCLWYICSAIFGRFQELNGIMQQMR